MKQWRFSLPALLVLGYCAVLSSSVLADVCAQKVDPRKVMIFIDLNANIEEVRAAERAACARGEKIDVIPADFEERHQIKLDLAQFDKKRSRACGDNFLTPSKSEECKTAQKNLNDEATMLDQKNADVGLLLTQELSKIKSAGGTLPAFILSGHDGGGHFYGMSGSTDQRTIDQIFADFPELKNSVQSVGLLGCYTAVPIQVLKWKGVFPSTKLLIGYEGSGPLGDKPAGQTYVEDLLKQEKQITGAANDKIMEAKLLNSVRGIQMVNSAVYIESTQCKPDGTKKEYYYNSSEKDLKAKTGKKFGPFAVDDCEKARDALNDQMNVYNKYYYGSTEIPSDSSSGPLRDVYTFMRQNEQCFDSKYGRTAPTGDEILYLLFFNSVKRNFARVFANENKDEGGFVSQMTPVGLEKTLRDQLEAVKKRVTETEADLADYNADPDKYKKKVESDYKMAFDKYTLLSADPVIQTYLSHLNGQKQNHEEPSEADKKKVEAYLHASQVISILSYKKTKLASGQITERTSTDIQQAKEWIKGGDERISGAKQEFESAKKNFWLPTLENLQSKSRKEIMENIHAINLIAISSAGTPGSEKVASLSNRMSGFLGDLDGIPFDWHEDSEHPSKPEVPKALPYGGMTPTGIWGYYPSGMDGGEGF